MCRALPLPLTAMLLVLCGVTGCSKPVTDIVATVSEDVGRFEIAGARATEDQLEAHLCLADAGSADVVTDRVLMQLRNKGYKRIALNVVPDHGERRRVVWTPQGGKQSESVAATAENPCAAPREAAETAHD